jgi:hypothetical protein
MTEMSIYRDGGGVYIAGEPPTVQAFSHDILAVADPKWLTYADGIITITASNGTVVYEVLSQDDRYVDTRLRSSALTPFVPPDPDPAPTLAEVKAKLRDAAARGSV